MKFKHYIEAISDTNGFISTPELRWIIRKNPSKTSLEEAIAASVIRQANPRYNITGHFPWWPEERMVLQQRWIQEGSPIGEWRDVPITGLTPSIPRSKPRTGRSTCPMRSRNQG